MKKLLSEHGNFLNLSGNGQRTKILSEKEILNTSRKYLTLFSEEDFLSEKKYCTPFREKLFRGSTQQRKSNLCFLYYELRGLSPNFHMHVSVSDLYIPRIGPHISCSRIGRSIVGIYKSFTDTWIWKLILWPRNSFFGIGSMQCRNIQLCS